MQILSDIASAAPKAQQEPQLAWSLTSVKEVHFGQAVLESKLEGAALSNLWTSRTSGMEGFSSKKVPIRALTSDLLMLRKRVGLSAVQPAFIELIWTAMAAILLE